MRILQLEVLEHRRMLSSGAEQTVCYDSFENGEARALLSEGTVGKYKPEPVLFGAETDSNTEIASDRFEINDDFESAAKLGWQDQRQAGLTIHQPANDDYFRWTAPADGNLQVDALFDHSQGNIDLELYDSDYHPVPIATHTGASDPLTEGWEIEASRPFDNVDTGPVSELGRDAWKVDDNGESGGCGGV